MNAAAFRHPGELTASEWDDLDALEQDRNEWPAEPRGYGDGEAHWVVVFYECGDYVARCHDCFDEPVACHDDPDACVRAAADHGYVARDIEWLPDWVRPKRDLLATVPVPGWPDEWGVAS